MTATLQFKAKVQDGICPETGRTLYQFIDLPTFRRSHCDMPAFRRHPKLGSLANSNMFEGILARERKRLFGPMARIFLPVDGQPLPRGASAPPECVHIDTSGFLAVVTITLQELGS